MSLRKRRRRSASRDETMEKAEIGLIGLGTMGSNLVLNIAEKGHRIAVQVQSTWFPLIDRNPQKFVPNIYLADKKDFIKVIQRVYVGGEQGSFLELDILR